MEWLSLIKITYKKIVCFLETNNLANANNISLCILGIALLTLSAQCSIKIYGLDIPLQCFTILFLSFLYEQKLAILVILSYTILVSLGFPLSANFSGGYKLYNDINSGYLIGNIITTFVICSIEKRPDKFFITLGDYILGVSILMLIDIMWASLFIPLDYAVLLYGYAKAIPYLASSLIFATVFKVYSFIQKV